MKLGTLLLSLLGISFTNSLKCEKPYTRKEIRELSVEERTRLFKAMRKLMEPDPFSSDKLSRFEKFARIHYRANVFAHGSPAFYPWHRIFLRYFELELQKIDPGVHLAYWDWSIDANEPEKSEIFTDEFLGKGDPDKDHRLTTGPFANITLKYPYPHPLRRKFIEKEEDEDEDDEFNKGLPSPEYILPAINEDKYSFFAYLMEYYHGRPHMYIGDYPSDFSTMYSPQDPIFYFHHTFVDLIWYRWQVSHPEANQYEGVRYEQKWHKLNDRMAPFNLTAEDALDTESNFFCYNYPIYPRQLEKVLFNKSNDKGHTFQLFNTFSNPLLSTYLNLTMDAIIEKVEKSTKGRSLDPINKRKIKKLKPIKSFWIEQEGLDIDDVRESEKKINRFIDAINKLPHFQPLAKQF